MFFTKIIFILNQSQQAISIATKIFMFINLLFVCKSHGITPKCGLQRLL